MDYRHLEKICSGKRICIWGFGRVGKLYAYLTLKSAGAKIECFCDKTYKEGASYEGIPLIKKEELYCRADQLLVFIAIKDTDAQKLVANELKIKGIEYVVFDKETMTGICRSLEDEADVQIVNKYRSILDDEIYLKQVFKYLVGYELNLNNPKSFNEKLQWLKIHDRNPLYKSLVDKEKVKESVGKLIGEKHIIPTIGVWDKFENIDFDALPEQFVLKCTHDTGSVFFCKDKTTFDFSAAEKKIRKALSTNIYWAGREWPYKDVKPRIIAEKYIGENLTDYKFLCFNGTPQYIFTCTERFSGTGLKVTWFDTAWNRLDFERHYPASSKKIDRPSQLQKMLEISRTLSEGIPFVRVDLYEKEDQIIFGELTFYPGSGFEEFNPEKWDYVLGECMQLPCLGDRNE